ncbi:MAG: amidohydrolase, partial [Oscillospiraceae bacterium]|nr:amidohydrolase [Oscillospiraceae bacterium]
MLFGNICYISPNFEAVAGAYVGTEGRHITYVGSEPPHDGEKYGRVVDGRGKLLIPGFFNAHSHLAMSLMRGYGEGLALSEWLSERIFPFEAKLRPDDIYWGTLLGCAELLRFGAVSCSDMYLDCAAAGRAFADSGMKASFSACFTGEGDCRVLSRFADAEAAAGRFHMLDDGRLRVDMSLHAEYTSDEALVRSLARACAETGLRMHVHVSETALEVRQCRERHGGLSPVEYLSGCGLFDVPTTAAHCVAVSGRDMEILREKNVTVATCPKSNLKLADGVCPAAELMRSGVRVALGTDSVTSNNNLNMLEEARFLSLLQKNFGGDPAALSPAETLFAASRAGALAQGRDDCGLIAPGYRADLAVVDISGVSWQPVHDLMNNLIYSGSGSD